ncbi:general vesicular transport factor p115-like [Pomacea canaliculata]|uniref:general vesicular transport factor p115-like n=1 Tax=Pomacea canaliculata TaxID=400727 RepID=UPI000D72FE20|nr:general vesicular transport factor p115-like [Pomacea canaliculata]
MDYFRNFLGTQQGGEQPSSAETIERLCHRVQTSSLLEDRRDAVRALKALSKKFRLEVGTQAMDVLTKVLETDRSDVEITGYALDTLFNVMSNEPSEEDEMTSKSSVDLGEQFTEIFIKKQENVTMLISLLEEYDFHIRWPTVRLLTVLLTNRLKDLQECILVIPMAVSKLMDLLVDSREIIRNDALLLLNQLTKGHANIQKIVAFENAFERILDIIVEEGASDGGIVVEDCLLLLLNLLKNNASNQNFFKEGSYIQRISPFLELGSASAPSKQSGWSAQKVTNIHLILQLVRTLVSPSNPQNQTVACQKVMNQCGLLQQLCSILMASGVPADVLTETINTVSEVIRGNQANQEYFASVLAPSNPPRPAIVVLLMSMVNEKQPFVLRCAVLYCFQSFLYKNEVGQSQIIQTLLPTTADVNTITAGQLLCGGLFSTDSLSNWFAAVALLHAVIGRNTNNRGQLLRVQLATSLGNPPVSLLQQCCNILAQGAKLQTRIGLLMLLCTWMADCPIAVNHFLTNSANVSYLISQVSSSEGDELELIVQGLCAFLLGLCMVFNDNQNSSFTKASLKEVIQNRIGEEVFADKLTQVAKNENYTRAAKKPHLNYKHPSEIVFDHEFTKLFKNLENDVLVAVSGEENSGLKATSRREHENLVENYKEVIKEQDQKLNDMSQRVLELQSKHSAATATIDELRSQVQQLKDQNALLKAQKGSQSSNHLQGTPPGGDNVEKFQKEIQMLRFQVAEKDLQIEQLTTSLTTLEASLASQIGDENKENSPSEAAVLQISINRLNMELKDLRVNCDQKDTEISTLRSQLEGSQQDLLQLQNNSSNSQGFLDSRVTEMTEEIRRLSEEKTSLQERLKKSNEENLKLANKIRVLEEEREAEAEDKRSLNEELETLKKEQDDLLVLLADQDGKINKFKQRLKDLGQVVEEDEEEFDDEEEEMGEEA